MPQTSSAQAYSPNAAGIALRGLGQMCDTNMEAARVLLRTQARAAAAFGWPDVSEQFDSGDERARHLFATGAEQMLSANQRASEAAAELQRQITRVVETQAATAAENWQRGIEELGVQANEGLNQLCETARQEADEVRRMTEQMTQMPARSQVHEGAQRAREAIGASAEEKDKQHNAAA